MEYGFDKMKLDLISAYVYPENERSKHVLEKLGFAFEGRMRLASTKWNGEVTDDLCYSIVRIP
ncbi:MAG: GNAT family N-acetyltransferase [Christensenellaceae bacterium]|nr:GNAT family N-acetyltransferase [Christensenellaceae bacterium]